MGRNLRIVAGRGRQHAWRKTACPACHARLSYRRSASPQIDACGFESYAFDCAHCGATVAGVIDPLDDTLLLAVVKPSVPIAKIAPVPAAPNLPPPTPTI